MGVCAEIENISTALLSFRMSDCSQVKLCLRVMQLMPLYSEIRDLSAWESAVQELFPSDEKFQTDEVWRLIGETFEFATLNLYTRFDHASTKSEYSKLRRIMKKSDVEIRTDPDLSGW